MTRAPGRVRIGCSGWQYAHWRGDFYPEPLAVGQWLDHYASRFDTVELNNPFYRLPERATAERWASLVPDDFVFAWKASRFLTHMKKLKEPKEPLERMFDRATGLGCKLGPILFQLPPRWAHDQARLDAFLSALPAGRRYAIELRDPTWYSEPTYRALDERGVAMCLHDMVGSASPRREVGPFLYLRFHGTDAKYAGGYPASTLRTWARWIHERAARGIDAYVYFNNDAGGHAPRDAARLREFVHA